jgi:hypothetical protein
MLNLDAGRGERTSYGRLDLALYPKRAGAAAAKEAASF